MLTNLIEEAEQVRKVCRQPNEFTSSGYILKGEDYERWIAKAVLWMEENSPSKTLTERFIEASRNAVGDDEEYFYTMLGILKAIYEQENRA